MRRYLILSFCLTAFLLLAGSGSMRAQGSCSASCIFGLCSCTITCPAGQTPLCQSGLFSASCTCIPPVRPHFPRRPVNDEYYDAARSLQFHLQLIDDVQVPKLSAAIDRVIYFSLNGTEEEYSEAEAVFADLFANMSEELRNHVKAWFEENGYEFPQI